MLRSLFIGFLILSALSSKDVGVGANISFAYITDDMLLEFFNSAVSCGDSRQVRSCPELGEIRPDKGSPAYITAPGKLPGSGAGDKNAACVEYDGFINRLDRLTYSLPPADEKACVRGIITCASDVSPPGRATA